VNRPITYGYSEVEHSLILVTLQFPWMLCKILIPGSLGLFFQLDHGRQGVRWDSMEGPSIAPSTPSHTALPSTISTIWYVRQRWVPLCGAACQRLVCWSCFLPAHWPNPTCSCLRFLEKSLRYVSPGLRSKFTDPFVDSCGSRRDAVVCIAMGTPSDMAELRLSNKGFQAFSLEHPYSRLQAHSLNPGDPYEPRPDVHGMLSVSA
jgi:hypothetical protein